MFVLTPLALIMMVTGIFMERGIYIITGERQIHSALGGIFSFFLTIMIVSGIVLYVYPILQKRKAQKRMN